MIATGKQMSTLINPDDENPTPMAEIDMPVCVVFSTAATKPVPVSFLRAEGRL